MYVGVDIGGTFTDAVAYDAASGCVSVAKVPSTPPELVDGFIEGLQQCCAQLGAPLTAIQRLAHGTTIATNAILERRGARLGILMTEGFRDVLVLGRMKRSQMYDLFIDPEVPLFLAPRRRIAEVRERLDAEGRVVTPLDEGQLRDAVARLVQEEGVAAVVVCYLHSYLNPVHERRTREVLAESFPALEVSLSSEVDPRFREYERLLVTAFDAYVRPVIRGYVGALMTRLQELGVEAPLQLMQSRGGLNGAWTALQRPVGTVLSGPAAGVIGASHAARTAGFESCISLDVGGTSADVALIPGGTPTMSSEGHIERYPLRLPMIDVRTVGAGGGSLAWIDEGGALKVGPQSAAALPGPACYGRGGTEPTVTDASLLLGYLNPEAFAGGLRLQPELAARAIESRVAEPLGFTLPEAALGIHRIINSRMAQALRLVSVERGHDPRQFVLVALGGAGPLHAGKLAEELHIPRVLIPPTPGVLSALGLLLAGVEHEYARSRRTPAGEADPGALTGLLRELDELCAARMARDGVPPEETYISHYAEMRYVGQSYELEVELPVPLDATGVGDAVAAFHEVHRRTYGYANERAPVEFVTFRSVHRAAPGAPPVGAPGGRGAAPRGPRTRTAWFEGAKGPVECPVYQRSELPAGFQLSGPAILEQEDTTTVVYPNHRLTVDPTGNLIIDVPERTP